MGEERTPGFETLCQHAGEDPSRWHGGATPPIYQNSLFVSPDCESFVRRGSLYPDVYDYTRCANPTTDVLEAKIAALERAEAARCFGSGMAAVSAAILSCVNAGDHVVAVEAAYGPTRLFLTDYVARFDVSVTFVEGTDTQEFVDALRPNTRLIYLETPSSMVFGLQDIEAVVSVAKERDIATTLDNSWASPYFQNPREMGVDLVLHSATKYLGGHSDIVAGVVAGSKERIAKLSASEGQLLGAVLDPFASWLMIRGLRTLAIRMERHQQSALRVAEYLEGHPRVAHVFYPGLDSHPQRKLACKQMRGASGLLSFSLKDAGQAEAFAIVNRLRYFGIGVSWGGFESLAIPVTLPSSPPGAPHGVQGRGTMWGARLHIGLETADDLLGDLERALH